jgi:hypothetical protein
MYTRNITEQMFMLIEGETFLLLNRTFFYKYNRMEKKFLTAQNRTTGVLPVRSQFSSSLTIESSHHRSIFSVGLLGSSAATLLMAASAASTS